MITVDMLSSVIYLESALETTSGDTSFLLEVVELFCKDLEECVPILVKAHAEKDIKSIRDTSHRIKGQALSLSCKNLSKTSMALEKRAKNGVYMNEEFDAMMESIDDFLHHARNEKTKAFESSS